MAKGDKRLKTWLAELYPDSLIDGWERKIGDLLIPCSVSPLHDKDKFDEIVYDEKGNIKNNIGDLKKPHYHLVISYKGTKSFSQVWETLQLLCKEGTKAPPPIIPRGSIREAVRYHIHMDHPQKAQYNQYEVKYFNGVEHEKYFRQNEEQEDELYCFILDLIEANNFTELWDLNRFLQLKRAEEYVYDDAFRYCRKRSNTINQLICSRRNKIKEEKERAKQKKEKGEL